VTWGESLLVASSLITGILVPVTLALVARGASTRERLFERLDERLDHIDGCIDSLRERVISSTELVRERASMELREAILRQDESRHALIDRMMSVLNEAEERVTRRIERLEERNRL